MKRVLLLCAIALLSVPAAAAGQSLSVQGERFAVDGEPRFLLFVSYFDGLHRPTIDAIDRDLQYLKDKGVDGIRIFPDWHAPRLLDSGGAVDSQVLGRLLTLLGRAAAKGLMVDVSFDPELPGITSVEHFREGRDGAGGLKNIAEALRDAKARNVVIDLCNEWDLHCSAFGMAGLKGVKDAIKKIDPARLVVVSARDEGQAVSFVKDFGFDAVTYHDPRDHAPSRSPNHNWATKTGSVVASLKARLAEAGVAAPVYLQEPSRFIRPGEHRSDTDDDPRRYATALANGRTAGAAAWTFHTLAGGDLSGIEPFSDLLLPDEQAVLDALRRP